MRKLVVIASLALAACASTAPDVHVPLSGRTMEFEGSGRCVSGC